MMFVGPATNRANNFNTTETTFRLRPYNQELNKLTQGLCSDIGLQGNDTCLFETRTAFDCVLRAKARKFGDI